MIIFSIVRLTIELGPVGVPTRISLPTFDLGDKNVHQKSELKLDAIYFRTVVTKVVS